MNRLIFILALLCPAAFGQALGYTPPAYAAYIGASNGSWSAWTSGAGFGSLGFTPPAIGIYCQVSSNSQWTPCLPGTATVVKTGTSANTDTAGVVTLVNGQTTSPVITFTGTYATAPNCFWDTKNATSTQKAALSSIAPQVSATQTTATVGTAPAASLQLQYFCVFFN